MEQANVITHEASTTAKNISKVIALNAIQYPFVLLSATLIPRMMGVETYGEYALLMSFVIMTLSMTDLGMGEIFGRFVAEFESRRDSAATKKLVVNMFVFKFALNLLASTALFSILYFTYRDQFRIEYFLLIVAIVLVMDVGGLPYTLLFGLNQLGKYALRDPMRKALSLVLILTLFHYFGLPGALAASLVVEGSLAVLFFFWTRKYFRFGKIQVDFSFLKPYLLFGFVFYISSGVLAVWQRLGNPLIAHFTRDTREVAFYDIANQIFLITATFIFLAIDYLIPIFTGLISTGKEAKLLHWSKLIIRYTTILCMMTFWAFMFTGRDFIPLIFGPGFGNIFPNGVVLLLSIFPMALVQLGYVFSVVYKEPLKYFRALVLAFAVFLTAGIVLIPRYASVGCAFATFASCTVLSITLCVMFRDELLPCLTGALKAAAPGIVFLPFILLRQGLAVDLALLIIAASAYLFVLLANQSLRIGELKEIVRAIRHRPEESYADAPVGGRMP